MRWVVLDGGSCDQGIRSYVCSDLDMGDKKIFLLRHLFSAIAPKPVLPSPLSDGSLLGGKEVVRDEVLLDI